MYTLSLSWPQPQSCKWKKTTCKGNTGFHTPEIDYNSIPLVMSQQRPERDRLATHRSVFPVKMYREVISVYISLCCQNNTSDLYWTMKAYSNVCFTVDLPSPHYVALLIQRYSRVQLIMQMLLSSVSCQVWTTTCWIVLLKAGIRTLSDI